MKKDDGEQRIIDELRPVVAQAVNSASLRARVQKEPDVVAREYGLSADAATLLRAMPSSLWDKTLREVGGKVGGELSDADLEAVAGGVDCATGAGGNVTDAMIGRAMISLGGRYTAGINTASCGPSGCCSWETKFA